MAELSAMDKTNNMADHDTNQEHSHQEQPAHGEAAQHGHTGEGAASVMAHLMKQGEKHRHQGGDPGEGVTSHG
jgi:hypothetical protein